MIDLYNHVVKAGTSYIKVQYYEKKSTNVVTKGHIIYKQLKMVAYVIPSQVMTPLVNPILVGSDLHLTAQEYQWLFDSL